MRAFFPSRAQSSRIIAAINTSLTSRHFIVGFSFLYLSEASEMCELNLHNLHHSYLQVLSSFFSPAQQKVASSSPALPTRYLRRSRASSHQEHLEEPLRSHYRHLATRRQKKEAVVTTTIFLFLRAEKFFFVVLFFPLFFCSSSSSACRRIVSILSASFTAFCALVFEGTNRGTRQT